MPNEIIGTPGYDNLTGTPGDDLIEGLGGDDQLDGGDGNDVVNGGDGHDSLRGGAGNDTVNGGTGNDSLTDGLGFLGTGGGNDNFFGGEGDDTIQIFRVGVAGGQLLLDGGIGNDLIQYSGAIGGPSGISYAITGDTIIANGGEGDDVLRFQMVLSAVIDAGTGNDHVLFDIGSTAASITLGAGSDLFELQWYNHAFLGAVTIEDFQAGVGGDRLLFDTLIASHATSWTGDNPFGNGLLRLVQSGADTLVQFNDPGRAPFEFATVLTLRNVTASALTAADLGFDPAGGSTAGIVLDGTALADRLRGLGGNDTINGLDGNDHIEGFAGNDTIHGGLGNDTILGGYGNDVYHGGFGDDYLIGDVGSDLMYGEDGNDVLTYGAGYGPGYNPPAASILLDGGSGNDRIFYSSNNRELDIVNALGGTGSDMLVIGLTAGTTVMAGEGHDSVSVELLGGSVQVSLGTGIDNLTFTQYYQATHGQLAPVVISDFTAGIYGDTLFLDQVMASRVLNWDGTTSPFATGHLQLVQQGADTLVQIDRTGGGDSFQTFLILSGVTMAALTATQLVWDTSSNFWQGSAPNDFFGGSSLSDLAVGQDGNDTLWGAGGNDTLIGEGGSDTLYGDAGLDRLLGGDGDDTLHADGNDLLIDGGAGNDTVVFASSGGVSGLLTGIEALQLANASLTLTSAQFASGLAVNSAIAGTGSLVINMSPSVAFSATQMNVATSVALTVNGTTGIDVIKGPLTAAMTVSAGDGADQIRTSNLADTIDGGDGNDKIMGLGGADVLTGGAGADQFRYLFTTDSGLGAGADQILDFTNGSDKLDFRVLDADPALAGRQALTFIGSAAFATDGSAQVRYGDAGADTRVEIDLNGDGAADMHILLVGHAGQALSGTEFLL